jgi:hypothetical protein
MITFGEFMTEIAVNPDAPEFSNSSSSPRRSSKIMPDEGKFNIIPLKISREMYDLLGRHLTPRYGLVAGVLDRRGDSQGPVLVKVSNQEMESLKELAEEIIKKAPSGDNDIKTAYATIQAASGSMPAV